ncbi:MAG: hypothetical protein AAB691_03580 [Patescibacteria group bacterium]
MIFARLGEVLLGLGALGSAFNLPHATNVILVAIGLLLMPIALRVVQEEK